MEAGMNSIGSQPAQGTGFRKRQLWPTDSGRTGIIVCEARQEPSRFSEIQDTERLSVGTISREREGLGSVGREQEKRVGIARGDKD